MSLACGSSLFPFESSSKNSEDLCVTAQFGDLENSPHLLEIARLQRGGPQHFKQRRADMLVVNEIARIKCRKCFALAAAEQLQQLNLEGLAGTVAGQRSQRFGQLLDIRLNQRRALLVTAHLQDRLGCHSADVIGKRAVGKQLLQPIDANRTSATRQRGGKVVIEELVACANQRSQQRFGFAKTQFAGPPNGARQFPLAGTVMPLSQSGQDCLSTRVLQLWKLGGGCRIGCGSHAGRVVARFLVSLTRFRFYELVEDRFGSRPCNGCRCFCAVTKRFTSSTISKINDKLIRANFAKIDFVDFV